MIICEKCKLEIDNSEHRVTYKEHSLKPIDILIELNFHQKCWIAHYEESLDKKIKYFSKQIMKNAQPLINEYVKNREIPL